MSESKLPAPGDLSRRYTDPQPHIKDGFDRRPCFEKRRLEENRHPAGAFVRDCFNDLPLARRHSSPAMHNVEVELPQVAASLSAAATPPAASLITLLLDKPTDIVIEIADHLPATTALSLALTCKTLYAVLFRRALQRITRCDRHLFLFALTRDLVTQGRVDCYYCHTCSKIFSWKCALELLKGEQAGSDASLPPHEHRNGRRPDLDYGLNLERHECVRRGYFTNRIPEVESTGMVDGLQALHTSRTGFMICCEYADDRLQTV